MTAAAPPPYPYTRPDVLAAEFQVARRALEGHPALASVSYDERNSLAQAVLDALEPWLLDDPGEEEPQLKALADARRKILVLESALTKARKAASKTGGAA